MSPRPPGSSACRRTLRYYEQEDLVRPACNASGYREYSQLDLRRLLFLTRERLSGMTMSDLKRYILLIEQGPSTIPERRRIMLDQQDRSRGRSVSSAWRWKSPSTRSASTTGTRKADTRSVGPTAEVRLTGRVPAIVIQTAAGATMRSQGASRQRHGGSG
ncbi:MerR family transcriptional regulator [Streptomyces sp. TSRI0107]|uniref:MerR family transcriptional regulator n=1 Tax=Streptomyces sp. TSRI0107 TaxID=1703942 RepID=UPI0009403702|nr:MerR family transcriptional regulator [Streptomyces sp. TSRI0107]